MKQSISVDLLPTTIRKIETLAFLRQVDVTDQLEQMIDSIASQEILKELGISAPIIQRHELPPLNNPGEVTYTFSPPAASTTEEDEDLAGHSVSSDDDNETPAEDEVSDEDDTEEGAPVDEEAEAEQKLTNDINEYLESISTEEEKSATPAIPEKKGLTKQTVEKPIGYTGEVQARKLGLSKHISRGAKVSALTSTSSV